MSLYSAYTAANAEVFAQILRHYLRPGSTIADVTYGHGVFWKFVLPDQYRLLASDLLTGTDCRALPYADRSMDAVILDPPYGRLGGGGSGSHAVFKTRYGRVPTMRQVLQLYLDATQEAWRVLRWRGFLIVKCQDQTDALHRWWMHVELITRLAPRFTLVDLIVVVRPQRPYIHGVQRHARKCHSYFLVFRKHTRRLSSPTRTV